MSSYLYSFFIYIVIIYIEKLNLVNTSGYNELFFIRAQRPYQTTLKESITG